MHLPEINIRTAAILSIPLFFIGWMFALAQPVLVQFAVWCFVFIYMNTWNFKQLEQICFHYLLSLAGFAVGSFIGNIIFFFTSDNPFAHLVWIKTAAKQIWGLLFGN